MFTGIIECQATLVEQKREGSNLRLKFNAPITSELKVDQSIAHDGVCLTVEEIIDNDIYSVVAIDETLNRTNLGSLKVGKRVNLERAATLHARLDGHIVQGHVDQTAVCVKKEHVDGSFVFQFKFDNKANFLMVDKGSICVNGVSLTLFEPDESTFQVAIIPYTYSHTNLSEIEIGSIVNIEFDIIGKYVQANLKYYAT